MKRSRASWTTAIAASALLAMPVGSWAQSQQRSATPSQTSRPAAGAKMQQGSANEHLRQAEAALNDIPSASLTGTAKTKVAELKRHIALLNKSASPAPGKTASAPAGAANWSTDVAAADRILTDLLGAGSTTGATEPAMTGTTGTAKAKPAGKTAAVTLDETAKTKLQEVRTHLTAFAASMSGTSSPSATPSTSAPSDDPSASASASAAAAPSAPVTPSAAAPASPSEPAASTAAPSATASAAPSAQAQTAQPAQSVDTESVKRHLTAARDSLSQLTQLPAAAQLTGDSRTQVSQLISNFNELITTNTEWRASYSKVQANLTALVGEGNAASAAPAAPTSGTPGAVGTSGTTGIDPAIRAKLVEFRAHLTEFEKAAGGASAGGASSPAASSAPAASATPAATAAPESTPTPAAAAPTTSPAEPAPTATAGSTASPSATAGTTGSTASPAAASPSPAAESPSPASAEPPSQAPAAKSTGHQGTHGQSSDAMRHIEAIEAILNGSSSSAGSTGTTGSTASKAKTPTATSLDRAQIEQIKTHLSELRKALNK